MLKMGIGDLGLGIGDWGLGIGPNPQSPIPNPHFYNQIINFNNINLFIIKHKFHNNNNNKYFNFHIIIL